MEPPGQATVGGLVFAQLYAQFPVVVDLGRQAMANSFNVEKQTGVDTNKISGFSRENGHRPFVVAGRLLRIPGRRIAQAVIDQIELLIISDPAPCASQFSLSAVQ